MKPVVVLGTLLALAVACAPAPLPRPPPAPAAAASAASDASPRGVAGAEVAPRPPLARKDHHERVLFGKMLQDDYGWLRNKGTPEVEAYLNAENDYADAMTAGAASLQKALYDEMLARVKEDDATPPVKDGAWLYYRRYEQGKQYAVHCRKRASEASARAREEIVLDVNVLGANEKFVDVEEMQVSDDGNLLAYAIDTAGFRQFVLKTRDLRTGKDGVEAIPRVDFLAWSKDAKTLLYVTEDAQTKRPNKLFLHTLGGDAAKDVLVYEEKDERFDLELERTRSRAFFVLTSQSRTTTEVRVIDTAKPAGAPRVVAPREQGHEYYVDHRGDSFYVRTNSGNRNFRVVSAPVASPGRAHWKEVIAAREDVLLDDVLAFQDHLAIFEQQDALPQLTLFDFKTGKATRVDQPEPIYDVAHDQNPELATSKIRVRYSSLKTPPSFVELDARTKARVVLKQLDVPTYDPSAYDTKRLQTTARDGTKVPVSLVFKKGTTPDGTHPLFLEGYGSYGYSLPLSFAQERVSLLDRGFVFALAHIRGGTDLGKKWHDQGRMAAKMNTFTDFIDVAESLKKDGWAKKDALVVEGRSAGGLLMGAVTNLRPELFRMVLAYVPFVDVMNTMLDETLPLTVSELEEWGDPKKKDDFETMLAYSPYDNVAAKAYPTMLVRTSYNDSQVMYWEPAKWVARLRAAKTNDAPLLFKTDMQPAGHGGHSGRYDRLKDAAFDYAFVLSQLNAAR